MHLDTGAGAGLLQTRGADVADTGGMLRGFSQETLVLNVSSAEGLLQEGRGHRPRAAIEEKQRQLTRQEPDCNQALSFGAFSHLSSSKSL